MPDMPSGGTVARGLPDLEDSGRANAIHKVLLIFNRRPGLSCKVYHMGHLDLMSMRFPEFIRVTAPAAEPVAPAGDRGGSAHRQVYRQGA